MAAFGHLTPGEQSISNLAGDIKHASLFTAPEDGILTGMGWDADNPGIEIQSFRYGAYLADGAGSLPKTLIASSSPGGGIGDFLLSANAGRRFREFSFSTNPTIFAGQSLWATVHFGPTGGNIRYYRTAAGTGRRVIADDDFASGLEADFGPVTADAAFEMAVYFLYVPATQQLTGVERIGRPRGVL